MHHRPERGTCGGFLLLCTFAAKARPFRPIDQVESRDGNVWNQFPVERQRKFRPVVSDHRSRGLVDTVGVALHRKRQAERGCVPIDFDSKIPGGYDFQFEFLADRAVISTTFCISSGRLALEFALADVAGIRADHEAKQMLGIDALCINAGRKRDGKTHDCRAKHFCTNKHSLPKAIGVNDITADRECTLSQYQCKTRGDESGRLVQEFRLAAMPAPVGL